MNAFLKRAHSNDSNQSTESESSEELRHAGDDICWDNKILRSHGLLFWFKLVLAALMSVLICAGANMNCWSSPKCISCNSSFDVDTARSHLKKVTNIGPRTAGSVANEIIAAEYIRTELKAIALLANRSNLHSYFDEHLSNYSSFRTHFHVASYNKVRNFIIRFHDPRIKSDVRRGRAFLVNCHYDTAVDSPGGSDAFANCAVMLEVCRAIATGSLLLYNDVIFLFNGAEEGLLLGSHAFITQHKWANDVAAFLNLEGAGAGKRLLVFQVGPGKVSHFLMKAYQNSFNQPYATVFAEDIFETGLLPSDTDFRIFRDYGCIPGMDLAYTADGYAYHTKYDTSDRISSECLQQSGNNLLNFVREIAKDKDIQNLPKFVSNNYTHNTWKNVSSSDSPFGMNRAPSMVVVPPAHRVVYFDLLGFSVVVIPWNIWKWINYFTIFVFCCIVCNNRRTFLSRWYGLACAILLQLLTHLLGFCFVLSIGLSLHKFGCRMTWFSNRYNIIGVFVLPTLWWFLWSHTYIFRIPGGVFFRLFNLTRSVLKRVWCYNPTENSFFLETDFFDAGLFFICLQLFILTWFDKPSSYIYVFWVILPIIVRMFLSVKTKVWGLQVFKALIYTSLFCLLILHAYLCTSFFEFVIPIMGRAGHLIMPDVIVSGFVFYSVVPFTLLLAGRLQCTTQSCARSLRLILLNACLSYAILVHVSPYGFPYKIQSNSTISDPFVSPRYQRLAIFHANRFLRYVPDAPNISKSESYIFLVPLDVNGIRFLTPNSYPSAAPASFISVKNSDSKSYKGIKELVGAKPTFCNRTLPYCGTSSVYPMLHMFSEFYHIPVTHHSASPSVKLRVVSRSSAITNDHLSWNFTFMVYDGPPNTHILIRVDKSHCILSKWSFMSTATQPLPMPLPSGSSDYSEMDPTGDHYFLYHLNSAAVGLHNSPWTSPWTFWVLFEHPGETIHNRFFDLAVAGIYIDDSLPFDKSVLNKFISKLPPWTVVMKGYTVYDHWRFKLDAKE